MRYRDRPSYRASLASIREPARLDAIQDSVALLVSCLERRKAPPAGLGLKPLRGSLWEIRAWGEDRVVISWSGEVVNFLIAGTPDQVRRAGARR